MPQQPELQRPTGSFVCPMDGTSDLDFVCAYDDDGPCGYVCPVCYQATLGPPSLYDVQAEAYRIFKNWVMAAMQRETLNLNHARHHLLKGEHHNE